MNVRALILIAVISGSLSTATNAAAQALSRADA
jgi:hypothetical protein